MTPFPVFPPFLGLAGNDGRTPEGESFVACDDRVVSITNETRKRLWGRSGNRCVLCRQELVRPDEEDLPGALVGEEAHIVARSPGGPRYELIEPEARDGYDNLILLCANDHTEIDAQPSRYTVEGLQTLKRRHELWVRTRLQSQPVDEAPTLTTVMRSGDDLWPLILRALGWSFGMPEGLTDEEEDLVDEVLQTITDWCDISTDVELHGLRSVREAKRSMTTEIDSLTEAGFLLLGGQRQAAFGGGSVVGPVVVLEVVRPGQLEALRVPEAMPGGEAFEAPSNQ